ncbi:hypothetical protein [Glycomyces harbinensis]|uniref:Tetratricopeptide repeat-containing protein n=1 Tax=Glycomyces harbinensis TaxID=58114 RepID=A0A1G6RDL5_9ACTN|nr:hypothetical protein [Glycomyces harbinensis]SDD02719.1 hypothetical protein SAMN05216270_101442 [Glycomyces harbinensis]
MPNRRHARRTHRDATRLAAAGNHQGALAVYASAAAEYRGCLAVHPGDLATRADFAELLADRATSHTAVGETAEAYAAQHERVTIITALDTPAGDRSLARLDLAEAAARVGRYMTAATEADAAVSLLDETDPTDPHGPGFADLANALARAARVFHRAADPDLAVGAADQATRMLIAVDAGGELLRDSLRLAAGLHAAAGRTTVARSAADLLAKRFPDVEPVAAKPPLTFRGALQTAVRAGAFADPALIDRLCPDPAGRHAAPTISARCDLGLAAVALHACEQAVDLFARARPHPALAWRIATEVHYLLTAADRQAERNLHLNFRDHGPSWLATLLALTVTGERGPITADLATALADLCDRLHTRHAAADHEPLIVAATRYVRANTDPLRGRLESSRKEVKWERVDRWGDRRGFRADAGADGGVPAGRRGAGPAVGRHRSVGGGGAGRGRGAVRVPQ